MRVWAYVLLVLVLCTPVLADTQYAINYVTSGSLIADTYTSVLLPNNTLVMNTTYSTFMTSSSGSPGNVRSDVSFTYNDSSSYTTPVVAGASSPINVLNPYPSKAVSSIVWRVYRVSGAAISVGMSIDGFWGAQAVPLLTIRTNDTVTGLSLASFCVSGSVSGLTNETNCTVSSSSVTSLLSATSSGANSKNRLQNFEDMVADGYDGRFNTTKFFSNGTHTFIAVPWYDSATACGVSNLKTYSSYTTVNMTRVVMVTDELSEPCLLTAMSNRSGELDAYYNTIQFLKSAYGDLPIWVAGIDFSNNQSPVRTNLSSDTASDGSTRLAQCMYIGSQNPSVTAANQTKYLAMANNLMRDHLLYETVTGSYSSAYGTISRLPMSGRNCAAAGVGNAQGTTGCNVDFYVGYFKDHVKSALMAYARTTNTTYLTAAEDYVRAYLSISLQADQDGDGYAVAPLNFNWNTTGNLRHSGGGAVNTYFYNNRPVVPPLTNTSWDDSDAPRDRTCDALRAANISTGGHNGVWANLSTYCLNKARTSTYTATTSCLQYYYNGTCSVSLTGGFYQNGLGALDHTYWNTSILDDKIDEAISHYGWSGKTFDSTSCGNSLTYRGVRTPLALGKAIGIDDEVYLPSNETVCESGNSTTQTIGGITLVVNSPGNNSQTTQNSLSLQVTIYNNNITNNVTPGTLPEILYNSSFTSDPSLNGWTLNSWSHTSAQEWINNSANSGGAAYTQNLSLGLKDGGFNISLNMSLGNITNAKIYFGTDNGALNGDRILIERSGDGGILASIKHDGGNFSTYTIPVGTFNQTLILVNETGGYVRVCTGASCWQEGIVNGHTYGDYLAFSPGTEMTQGGWNISNINVTNTGTAYNITTIPSSLMNVTFYNGTDNTIIGTSNSVSNGSTTSITWSGLTNGQKYWRVNVRSVNENRNFSNSTFTVVGSQTISTICTENGSIVFTNVTNGNYDFQLYNVSGNTYYNQTSNSFPVSINTTISYWQNLTLSTYQALLELRAYKLFLNTSIAGYTATNGVFANTTTGSVFTIPASNGTNNVMISVPGNFTANITCNIANPFTTGYCNATGIHDHELTLRGTDAVRNTAIIGFNIKVNSSSFGNNIINQNTTNTSLTIPLLRGYTYTINFTNSSYALASTAKTPTNASDSHTFTIYTQNSVNITFYDEETKQLMNYTTVFLELIGDVFSGNYSTTNGRLFIDLLIPTSYTVRYGAAGYSTRFNYVTISSSSYNELNLSLLNTSSATNVTVFVYDEIGRPVEGALVKVLKYDVLTNTYPLNQIIQTNFAGQNSINVELNNEYYKFIIESNGTVLYTSSPTYVFGDTLTFRVTLANNGFSSYFATTGLYGNITFNPDTRYATYVFSDPSNQATEGCLYVYESRSRSYELINSSCSSGSAGSISLPIPNTSGSTYTLKGRVTIDDIEQPVASYIITTGEAFPASGKRTGLLILFMVMTVCAVIVPYSLPASMVLAGFSILIIAAVGLVAISMPVAISVFLLSFVGAYLVGDRS